MDFRVNRQGGYMTVYIYSSYTLRQNNKNLHDSTNIFLLYTGERATHKKDLQKIGRKHTVNLEMYFHVGPTVKLNRYLVDFSSAKKGYHIT